MRARHLVFVVLVWLMLVAGVVNTRLRIVRDLRLHDATPPTRPKRLHLRWDELASGRFQAEVERRLDVTWGFRGALIRTDNALNEWLFGETRPGRGVVVGEDGVLFSREDVSYFNRTDVCDACDELARRLARAQRALLAGGRLVLPVIVPAKTTTERAALPARWWRIPGGPVSDARLYQRTVDALTREGVLFVDGRARLLALRRETGRPVFPPEARHWSQYAACLVYNEAIGVGATALGLTVGPADLPACTPAMAGQDPTDDLARVMNVLRSLRPWRAPRGPAPRPQRQDLRLVLIGTSFLWSFADLTRDTTFGLDARYYYYDDLAYQVEDRRLLGKIDPADPAWRAWTRTRNLYLVDLLETYLPSTGYREFLDQLEAVVAEGG